MGSGRWVDILEWDLKSWQLSLGVRPAVGQDTTATGIEVVHHKCSIIKERAFMMGPAMRLGVEAS